ncbi:MAG TPA: hypothetical protein VF432_01835 [Thermoanaerobaculia bacterium]
MSTLALALGGLVDRSIQLIRARHDHRKSLFDNCIKPVYDVVDGVHSDYTKTFGEYRTMVRACATGDQYEALVNRIADDMTLTIPLRVKLTKLRIHVSHEELRTYRDRVRAYVKCVVRSHRESLYDNAARLQIIAELDRLLRLDCISDIAKKRADRLFDRQLRSLNHYFAAVVDEFEVLRSRLIL